MPNRDEPRIDLVVTGARIYREPGHPVPGDAIAIRGGRIAAIGPSREVVRAARGATRVVEARGRTLLPAFIDSHTHFHRGAVLRRLYLDFEALAPTSVADVLVAVAGRAGELTEGAWIQGDSLSPARLAERRLPDRHELDAVAPAHPVVLRGIGKHVVAASSAALAAAGITRDTPDPDGGRIERDEHGDPTGILHERAKLRLDQSHPETVLPSPAGEERRAALEAGVADLHRAGISTIHEMVRLPEEADDYAALRAEGRLRARVRLYYRVHESPLSLDWLVGLGIRRGLGDDWLRVLGVKVSVDGFCVVRNAAVHEPYPGEPGNRGLLRIEPGHLRGLVERANRQGLNVAVHAVGARALEHALEAYEAAGAPVAGPHRIEHAYVDVDDRHLDRMGRLGLVWSVQPAFRLAYATEWREAFGAERAARLMPLAGGLARGVPVIFNSDFPCVPIDPLSGIRAAADAVPIVEAWRAYTTAPADVAGDRDLGRLEVGAHADLVVLDDDPFEAGSDVARLVVRATMVAGSLVHGETEVTG